VRVSVGNGGVGDVHVGGDAFAEVALDEEGGEEDVEFRWRVEGGEGGEEGVDGVLREKAAETLAHPPASSRSLDEGLVRPRRRHSLKYKQIVFYLMAARVYRHLLKAAFAAPAKANEREKWIVWSVSTARREMKGSNYSLVRGLRRGGGGLNAAGRRVGRCEGAQLDEARPRRPFDHLRRQRGVREHPIQEDVGRFHHRARTQLHLSPPLTAPQRHPSRSVDVPPPPPESLPPFWHLRVYRKYKKSLQRRRRARDLRPHIHGVEALDFRKEQRLRNKGGGGSFCHRVQNQNGTEKKKLTTAIIYAYFSFFKIMYIFRCM
jgi:hypothetical protein